MEHVQKLTLDMGLRVTPPKLYAKQGDKDTRKITCELVMDGMPYALGEGVAALYALRKPDDTQVIENAQLSGSACSLILSDQCLTVPGVCLCEVILYKDDAVLASATFEVDVSPNVYDEDGVISSDDYGALVAATAAANTATQEANSAAALANEKAELAGQRAAQAQEQAQAAQTQASAAQAAAAAANAAKTAADTAAQAANTAAQNAQTQADYAQQQGDAVADIIEQGGFASVGHKHDAADMTSGILPVARGGTGVASLSEMGFSNPNLLVNGGFDVWQRGAGPFSVGATAIYTADRWAAYAINGENATVEKQDAGVISLTDKYAYLVQVVEPLSSFDRSKPYTFSADLKRDSGNTGVQMGIALKNSIEGEWIYQNQINANAGVNEWNRVSITSSGLDQYEAEYLMVYIKVNAPSGGTLYARRAKLEQGSVATQFIPRHYIEELMLLANDRALLDFEFLNEWSNYDLDNSLMIWKDPWNYVHLLGTIKRGTDQHFLTLPSGFIPERTYGNMVRNASTGVGNTDLLFINRNGECFIVNDNGSAGESVNINAYFYGS
ncbi:MULTISPECIES: BppU family phage baseplate upper protein [unclassified Clostridium]|uniref:BppU family phage baseplate upper protein n=1 Tax=unclassified Clostridium TaxID=2614128 RepID=UPI001105A95C|nr:MULTISPECIES: BppU family phage baseplate upper protein [unclassified Clostridium]